MAKATGVHTTSNQEAAKTGPQRKSRVLSLAKEYGALFSVIGTCVAIIVFVVQSLNKVEQRVGEKMATFESSLTVRFDGRKELMADMEADIQAIATTMQSYHTEQSRAMEEIRSYLFHHQAQHEP